MVTQEIKSQTQVWAFFYVQDFFFVIFYGMFGYLLARGVASSLLLYYGIFHGSITLLLTLPSPYNKKRKLWQSLVIALTMDKGAYFPPRKEG